MKNIINITTEGEQLVSSTDDGTNTLYINDNEIASSNWIGSGNYTTTVNGHAITIKKCTDLNGNCQLIKLSDYNYEMRKTALAGQLQMLNYIYPVGSYYETSDASFNPNVVWGGTWVKVAGGLIKGEPLITRMQERKTTDTTVSNSSGINLLTVQHTSNTGKIWVYGAATVKTSIQTSAINIDANGQMAIGQQITNLKTYTRLTVMTQRSGMPIGTPFTVALRMTAQDTSTTATCAAYTTSQLFVSDVPLKMGYCWHRTA